MFDRRAAGGAGPGARCAEVGGPYTGRGWPRRIGLGRRQDPRGQ